MGVKGIYNYRKYDDDFVTKVMRDIKRGDFIQVVAERHNVSFSSVMTWAKQLSLVVKKAPRKARHDWDAIKKNLK